MRLRNGRAGFLGGELGGGRVRGVGIGSDHLVIGGGAMVFRSIAGSLFRGLAQGLLELALALLLGLADDLRGVFPIMPLGRT